MNSSICDKLQYRANLVLENFAKLSILFEIGLVNVSYNINVIFYYEYYRNSY